MTPPTPLAISTASLNRLLKEVTSYRTELEQQQSRIQKLENESEPGENAEFQLNQERKAAEETQAMFPTLRKRIHDAADALEKKLSENEKDYTKLEEVRKAREMLNVAKYSS